MPRQRIGSRWLITVAVMSAMIMQVLDTTIVNVALPHMQGSLGANPDQITWVLTSYLVASGIFMPLTGFLTDRLGQKRYLMISIVGFVIASMLCGISTSLAEIVLFRLLQGVFGAGLAPISQSIMVNTFPREQRGSAMAIWGIGIMIGPILGPTLGGWLTEALSWRWTFYINLPVGLLSIALTWLSVRETEQKERKIDWRGLGLIALGIGALQFMLDRGNQENWFESNLIKVMALLSAVGIIGFLVHSLTHKKRSLFNLRIFTDRNYTTSAVLIFALGLSLYGTLVLQPLLLEGLLNYPVMTTGLVMAPRGVATAISMFIVGRLINRFEPRLMVFVGIILSATGSYFMTRYNLFINNWWVIFPIVLQGFGMGLIFVPLATVAYATLPNEWTAEAAGMYNLLRTIGSSIGISIVSTVLSRETQAAWNQLGGHLTRANPALYDYLHNLHLSPESHAAGALLGGVVERQARMIGFIDAFLLIFASFVVMLPLLLLMRRINRSPAGA